MTEKKSGIATALLFAPLVAAMIGGVGAASRYDDPLAVAAGIGAALAVGVVFMIIGRWLLLRK